MHLNFIFFPFFKWTVNVSSFDVSVVILTPGSSETCLKDRIFAMKSLLKCTFRGNNLQSATSFYVTDPPFVNILNSSSAVPVLIFATKSGFLKTVSVEHESKSIHVLLITSSVLYF